MTSDLERTRNQAWVEAMDRLNNAQPTLRIDEAVYAELFNQMPTPIWIEDWSGVPPALEERGLRGRPNLEHDLQQDLQLLMEVYSNVVQLDMNDAALAFFSESSKRALVERLYDDPPFGSLWSAAVMLAALDRGAASHSWSSQCQPYPDGAPRWIKETYYVPPAFRETWARVIYTVHDVTDLKMTERNVKRARLEADAANRSKTEFLANISHEFRTPLHAISGFSELLIDQKLGPLGHDAYRDYALFIRDSGEHLLDLINDILDLSKYEAGELSLREEEVIIRDAFDSSIWFVRERASRMSIALDAWTTPNDAVLLADGRKLKQILLNLLDNAVKFTGHGGKVTLSGSVETSGDFCIRVEDTGVGIEPQDQMRVLERFGQTGDSRNQGTGLGLPLSKALTELHGGTLRLDSRPGVGTRVTVRLPASRLISPSQSERGTG